MTPASTRVAPDGACDLDPPLVLKPIDDGSSVDLRICRTVEEVAAARVGWPAPESPQDAIDEAEYDLALLEAPVAHELPGVGARALVVEQPLP